MLKDSQLLLLEDENLLRKTLCQYLESLGAHVYPAETIAEARRIRESTELDFALIDVNLPDGSGLDLMNQPGFSSNTKVVVMTADGGIRTAVDAIQRGASDYLSKPFDPEELPLVFSRIDRQKAQLRKDEFERKTRTDPGKSLFLGKRLRAVQNQLDKILQADSRLESSLPPVLIEGETGTGKSTLARWLHQNGPRQEASLVEINCSTLPESLAEAEMFGHERGAFTDARKERIGLFEAADGGSLFLDEISSLSPTIQAKVLTAIEDGTIRRLGGNAIRRIDVRLIAASLHPLLDLVKEGNFREDLYHRLNPLHVRIPSLREFPEDIPELAEYILAGLKKRYRMPQTVIAGEGMHRLTAYPWPGNVRELIHEIERSLIFCEGGPLTFEALSFGDGKTVQSVNTHTLKNPNWVLPERDFNLEEMLKSLTLEVILEALRQENENVSAAARRLGVPRDFIRYRLES